MVSKSGNGWKYVFGRRKRVTYPIDYSWQYKDINVRRPPLEVPRKGPGPKGPGKTRVVNTFFNNEWQENRYLTVKNVGLVEACQQRGIQVVKPEELFTPHLPEDPTVSEDFEPPEPLIKGPYYNERDHPHFHERPAHCFNAKSLFAQGQPLECAQVLLKTVLMGGGKLPERVLEAADNNRVPDAERMVKQVLMESQVLDATQIKLPRNVATPYIGWHPVEDRMFRKMPYDVTNFSWGRRERREYGIPVARRNLNLTRGLLRACDSVAGDRPSLLSRMHLENTQIRQFIERKEDLIRFFVPIQHMVTDSKPLAAYADSNEVQRTQNMTLPNIEPLDPHCTFYKVNVYNDQVNFPIKPFKGQGLQFQNVHSGIIHNNEIQRHLKTGVEFASRSLALAFLMALGQAKLLYGPEVSGELPAPVAVNLISTDGKRFHFSAYQLNTLDLDNPEGVKNMYWGGDNVYNLYEVCDYVKAVPTLQGYNQKVFDKFAALYLENSK